MLSNTLQNKKKNLKPQNPNSKAIKSEIDSLRNKILPDIIDPKTQNELSKFLDEKQQEITESNNDAKSRKIDSGLSQIDSWGLQN